jgi:Fe2+ or Zn2+ uptake regulation protein
MDRDTCQRSANRSAIAKADRPLLAQGVGEAAGHNLSDLTVSTVYGTLKA